LIDTLLRSFFTSKSQSLKVPIFPPAVVYFPGVRVRFLLTLVRRGGRHLLSRYENIFFSFYLSGSLLQVFTLAESSPDSSFSTFLCFSTLPAFQAGEVPSSLPVLSACPLTRFLGPTVSDRIFPFPNLLCLPQEPRDALPCSNAALSRSLELSDLSRFLFLSPPAKTFFPKSIPPRPFPCDFKLSESHFSSFGSPLRYPPLSLLGGTFPF